MIQPLPQLSSGDYYVADLETKKKLYELQIKLIYTKLKCEATGAIGQILSLYLKCSTV